MNWFNLRKNKCPKCNKDFGFSAYSEKDFIICPNSDCNFKISHKRFSEIVNSQTVSEIDKYHQEAEKVREDLE